MILAGATQLCTELIAIGLVCIIFSIIDRKVEKFFRTVDFDSLSDEAKAYAESRYGESIKATWLFYENGARCIAKRSLALNAGPKIRDSDITVPENAAILFKSLLADVNVSNASKSDIRELMAALDIDEEEDYYG